MSLKTWLICDTDDNLGTNLRQRKSDLQLCPIYYCFEIAVTREDENIVTT